VGSEMCIRDRDNGRPIVLFDPNSPAAQELKGIAQLVASELSIRSYQAE
jgi:MinD-like ATPase involved in chromosome partitioning or flagellar assembly